MRLLFMIVMSFCSVIIAYNYEGCKVYEVLPEKPKHQQVLELLHSTSDFDFWSHSRILKSPVIIMVKPNVISRFHNLMKKYQFKHKELIQDVGRLFEDYYPRKCRVSPTNGSISLDKYNSYKSIKAYLTNLQKNHPDKVDSFEIGRTIEGRDIMMVKLSVGEEMKNKPAILIDAGIHAREWIGPATILYLINRLVENKGNEEMLRSVNWYIVPVLNPDGYEFSQKVDRLWRKNRSKGRVCMGVDANRNFDYHWMEGGSSADECSDTYAGKHAFSERETIALRDFVLQHKHVIKLYITVHSYGNFILYPWNYSPRPPDNVFELNELARNVSNSIERVHGTQYTIGTSNKVLYQASGNSEDWVKGKGEVQLSFAIELPGGGKTGFDVPEDFIRKVGQETFEGFKTFWKHVKIKYSGRRSRG